jgi:hypothetical protein
MVMALVTDLGKVRPVCMSRFYLNRALDALEQDNVTQAGILLREGIARYLAALCTYHGCLPKKKRERTPSIMLRTLWKKKQFTDCGYQWCREAIEYCNRLAHCRAVKPSLIEACISLMWDLMDSSPELIFPIREGNKPAIGEEGGAV